MALTKVTASIVDLDGGIVINESSADADFRVESNGQTHALFVDGGLDNIGIGYSAAHTATNKGLAILTGDGNGGVQFNKEDGSYPSDGETLGSIGWKGADSANSNAAAGASIVGIAAEDFSGSTEATNLAFNTKPTGTGPGSAPTERMRINSNGTIGIGTAGGSYAIDLLTTGNNGLRVNTGTSSADQLYLGNTGGVSSVGTLTSDDLGIITAGSERMRITSAGRLGLGTTNPSQPIHVATSNSGGYLFMDDGVNGGFQIKTTTSEVIMEFITTGFGAFETADLRANFFVFKNSGTNEIARIESDNFSHIHSATAHTNGIKIINSQAGGYGSAINFQSERSDNNAIATAARIRTEGAEAWNAADAVSSALVFETVADNTLAERMRISSGGNLTLGGSTVGAAGALSVQPNSDDGAPVLTINRSSTSATSDPIRFKNGGSTVSQIAYNSTEVTYGTTSDARLKNILGKAKGLEIVNKLNPVNFEWKDGGEIQDGLIAQEVAELIPNAVNVNDDGYYSMDYSKVVTPLIKAIQEQQKEIEELKQNSHPPKTIEEMEGYEDLINRIKELENK